MSQNLISNLTLRIEQRKANDAGTSSEYRIISAEHRKLAEQCRTKSEKLASKRATYNGERYQSDGRNQAELISVQAESQNLAQLLQQQTQETATLLNQQAEQLEQLKAQSAQLNSMSQGIAETAKIKKTLFTSNIVLASIALILLISSIALGYVSKSKYNDINEMQNKVDYLKSQGGSMFTMECGNCA